MRWKFPGLRLRGRMAWSPHDGLLRAVQCLACMAVAWILAQCFWWLATPGSAVLAASASPALVEQSHRVTARHFFEVADVQQPSSDDGAPPPPSGIDGRWRLLGTYVDSGGRSRALLTLEGQADVVLAQVGDRLPSGHEVVDVLPERVLLSKDSQRGELVLRPTAQTEPGQMPPEDRFGAMGRPPSADTDPFNKDSR